MCNFTFFLLVTEFEIDEGLKVGNRAHCLCFIRLFSGLDNAVVSKVKNSSKFTELMNKHGVVSIGSNILH